MKHNKQAQPLNSPDVDRVPTRRSRAGLPAGLSPTDHVLLANHLLRKNEDINPFYLDDCDD